MFRPAIVLGALFVTGALAHPYGTVDDFDRAIAVYEDIARSGGWSEVPAGDLLKRGDEGERVAALARRLGRSGELREGPRSQYDAALEAAVRLFQERHGITVDGKVGPETLAALNTSAVDRLFQLTASRKRLKDLENALDKTDYVLVNIPDYRLYRVRGGQPQYTMRVVVGQEGWNTPTMHEQIEEVVVNPYWNVPASIVVAEIAPKMIENPAYLLDKQMEVRKDGYEGEMVHPNAIDWAKVAEEQFFPYFIRQRPGPENPLGKLKFLFPNAEAIYLHDTPHQALFDDTHRQHSHGCIRISEPRRLARDLLGDAPALDAALQRMGNRVLQLNEHEPVHLVYLTAWVAEDGTIQFRHDIYGRDS